METCIDDVLRASVVPPITAAEEVGPCAAYAAASVPAEDPLSLAGKVGKAILPTGLVGKCIFTLDS